jgi:indole-3-glycerol phosphate synthase
MANILDEIVATKWREIAAARERVHIGTLERAAEKMLPARGFAAALNVPGDLRIIAEVKKASPSAGVIREDFDPVKIAETYEAHGAAAISVLTDEQYFQGHLNYLKSIRHAVGVPVLRKEFIVDRYQMVEAVLLIAEILPGERLKELYREADELGLDVLVELHDAEQLHRVIDCGAQVIGINNRDLRTFTTRLEQTLELRPLIPSNITVVSESGIRGPAEMQRLKEANIQAVLVGESLMRSSDIGAALDALRFKA